MTRVLELLENSGYFAYCPVSVMKTCFLLITALSLVATSSRGQLADTPLSTSATNSRSERVKKLIQMSGGGQARTNILVQMRQSLSLGEEFWVEFEKEFSTDALVQLCVPIYEKHLTDEEINGLITFYESPLGVKLRSKSAQIAEDVFLASFEIGKRLAQRHTQAASEVVQPRPYSGSRTDITKPPFSFATLSDEQRARLLRAAGYDPDRFTLGNSGEIDPKPVVSTPPPPTQLPSNVRYIVQVLGTRGNAIYYSEKEPKANGSGYKFVAWPTGLEMTISGEVTITKVGKD